MMAQSRSKMEGKSVLVVGGSRGIGRACCVEFARAGANVGFIYKSATDAAQETLTAISPAQVKSLSIQVDVTDPAAVRDGFDLFIETFGRLDVMVHAAGAMVTWSSVRDHDPQAWAKFIDNDLCGAFHTVQNAVRIMHDQGAGSIVAISSIAAQMCQARNSQGAAAKAGLEALIRVVAREEGRHGIRANAVAVGLTDTDMTKDAAEVFGKDAMDKLVRSFPIQRIARPEEIARVVSFLSGDDAAYITGKVLQVDGGQIIAA
jgi:NAD(P)-dependent dehydrogenase (short-subunit alcohol dehydrogenase family)